MEWAFQHPSPRSQHGRGVHMCPSEGLARVASFDSLLREAGAIPVPNFTGKEKN